MTTRQFERRITNFSSSCLVTSLDKNDDYQEVIFFNPFGLNLTAYRVSLRKSIGNEVANIDDNDRDVDRLNPGSPSDDPVSQLTRSRDTSNVAKGVWLNKGGRP